MPELPEVESLRRGLVLRLRGQTFKQVIVHKPKLVSGKGNIRTASPAKANEFKRELEGEIIANISRRAKNLIFEFKSGKILLVHLKMTGQLIYAEHGTKLVDGGHPIELSENALPNKHTHIEFKTSRGVLYYNDTRMFGYLLYFPTLSVLTDEKHFDSLGLEPLDKEFTIQNFSHLLKARKGKLKTVLMDQRVVTGLGNIYADEVCFRAKIKPTRRVESLTLGDIKNIFESIKKIIPKAIELGGSSVADYRLADGSRGNYAREHKVYNHGGMPCAKCNTILKKIVMNGRTTVFCSRCQK